MGVACVDNNQEGRATAGQAATKMYTDDEISRWEPLMPLDRDRMTPKQIGMIMQKMYEQNAVVYNWLAEL